LFVFVHFRIFLNPGKVITLNPVTNNSLRRLSVIVVKKVLIIILSLFSLSVCSQDSLINRLNGSNCLQINLSNLLVTDVSINYCKFFKNKSALELIIGYRFGWKEPEYDKFAFLNNYIQFTDPSWFYNKISSRIGIRYYNKDKSYVAPMLMFSYCYYDNIYFERYEDYDGISHDKNYVISREKYLLGSLVKIGKTYNYKFFMIDLYAGIGFRFIIKLTSINQKFAYDNRPIADNYPLKSSRNSIVPTFHTGIQIGLKFK
jgi:hypothetical protein